MPLSRGGYENFANAQYTTVGGGGNNTANGVDATIGGGLGNVANGSWDVIGGGYENTNGSFYSTVSGGQQNNANAEYGTVGGGNGNSASSTYATVGGGNLNNASGEWATISGGTGNTASGPAATATGYANQALSSGAAVAGGGNNIASGFNSFIGGGSGNVVTNQGGTIGAGYNNTNTGQYATIPGGSNNLASGTCSFAAGQLALATNNGAFVWADSTGVYFGSASNNTFSVRASGGYRLYSSATAGVWLPAGSGTWNSLSDRNAKNHLTPVNAQAALAGVMTLPISRWSYKTEPGVRHMGPMAQDFHAAFGVGENNTTISTVDEEGVALAAIQGLNQKLDEARAENVTLKQQNDLLAQRLNELEAKVDQLAAQK